MAEEIIKPENPEKEKLIGSGEGEVPLAIPSESEVNIRTLASDLESLKQTGGVIKPETETIPPPKEEIIQPESIGLEEAKKELPKEEAPSEEQKTLKKKFPLGLFILIVVIVGAGVLGYFFVYPLISPLFISKTPSVTIPQAPPTLPPSPSSNPTPTTTIPQPEPIKPLGHVSLFKTPPDQTLNSQPLELLKLEDTFKQTTSSVFIEIILLPSALTSTSSMPIAFSNLLKENYKWPADLADSFEDNYSMYIYKDKEGNLWPGFVGQLKSQFKPALMQKKYSLLIESLIKKEPSNYFWNGVVAGEAQTWKNIKFGNLNARVLNFSKTNYTINYAWVENKLIIGSSFEGLKEALKRL